MKEWIISLISISIISSIIIIILPKTSNGKLIKSIISVVFLITIIKPFYNFDFNNFSFENNLENYVQSNYIDYIYEQRKSELVALCEKVLNNYNINEYDINVIYNLDENYNYSIFKIQISINKNVINTDKEHIDILEIKNELIKKLNTTECEIEILIV